MSKERPRNKRKNPAFGLPGLDKMLADTAGNLLVTSALMGASLEEKMLIGSLIPAVLKIIRGTPAGTPAVFALDGVGELTRAPVTAKAEPKAEPDTPEAKK